MDTFICSPDVAALRWNSTPLVSRDGDQTVVWLDGEHDIATATAVADTLTEAICADHADLVVDLSGVTFIGVAIIRVLIRERAVMRRQSRILTLRAPSRCAQRLIDVCGLTDMVESPRTTGCTERTEETRCI